MKHSLRLSRILIFGCIASVYAHEYSTPYDTAQISANTLLLLGKTYQQSNDIIAAEQCFTKALANNPSPDEACSAHECLSTIALSQGNKASALEHLLLAYAQQPDNVSALARLAELYIPTQTHPLCYLFSKQAADILSLNHEDLTKFPERNITIYDILSVSAWHMHDYNRGFDAVKQAITLAPQENTHFLKILKLYLDQQKKTRTTPAPFRVIQLQPNLGGISGVEQHLAIFNKVLYQNGIYSQIITSPTATFIVNKVGGADHAYGLPCITYHHSDYLCRTSDLMLADPTVIVCSSLEQVEVAVHARPYVQAKIIYVNHNSRWHYTDAELAIINNADAIVTVHFSEADIFRSFHQQGKIKTGIIEQIPPFVDDEKFLSFKPTCSKQEFLQQRFGLTINDNLPIISCIGNFYWFKNHGLLVQALGILKNERKKRFHALLAGHGPDLPKHKETAHSLGLDDSVHFIGLTHETPELLYHSNCHVLASYDESFGLVHVEAALMKKPFVAARSTGITQYIDHGVNGFAFVNQDAHSLADALEFLIDNPDKCQKMGQAAYDFACKELTARASFTKWQKLFSRFGYHA